MKIDRSNYESFFIDYTDGNLPDELVNDFLDFLKSNPDLAEELKAVNGIKLQPEKLIFTDKSRLLKTDKQISEPDDFRAVAYLEGDFSPTEKNLFETELAENDELLKTVQLLAKTKLRPETSVLFPDKEKLLRKNRRVVYIRWMQAATVLLLFLGLWAILPRNRAVKTGQPIASQSQQQPIKPLASKLAETAAESQPEASIPQEEKLPEKAFQPETTKKTAETNGQPNPQPEREALVAQQLEPLWKPLAATGFNPQKVKMEIAEPAASAPEPQTLSVEQYLAHKLVSAPKGENFSLGNVANAGLAAAQNLSNDRLEVERTENGRLEQIKFESRLIAFSIPLKKNR